ncbi:MAG: hypothetical protein ABI570_07620 [Ilumatobacteraceae bacterium]
MSATDWESRELQEASRERLLTEIGMLRQSSEISKAEELERQVVELKLELLAARDFAMGAAAQGGEQQAELDSQSDQLAAAQARIVFLSKHINRMRESTTWKLGRIIMLPTRIAKRILRRFS